MTIGGDSSTMFYLRGPISGRTTAKSVNVPALPPEMERYVEDNSLKIPIVLKLENSDGNYWLASHSVIMTYGVGDSPQEATEDFLSALVDLFIELVESEEVLSPSPEK